MSRIFFNPTIFVCMLLNIIMPSVSYAQNYQLGHGYKINDNITLGGYFSTEYANGDNEKEFKVDDLAILIYGTFSNNYSYMLELESVNFYKNDFLNNNTTTNIAPAIERLYIDYKFSDYFAVRAGKQITPIGYWNLQPINVLRESTSNPIYSRVSYPKFLTGLDFYGFTPFDDNLQYHFYLQATEDLDDEYINIQINNHFGFSVEREFQKKLQIGASIGSYTEINDTRVRYFQLNSKYESALFRVKFEGIIDEKALPNATEGRAKATYIQSDLKLKPKHTLIARAEYYSDETLLLRKKVGIIGYSYRPVFPVSIKAEYQWHSNASDNKVLTSFSVLF